MASDAFGHTRDSEPTIARCDYRRKIVSARRLVDILAQIRVNPVGVKSTIVQCHGCFDIVHPGHIRYLQFARRQGDVLVVSITGDATIDKDPQRPQIPQELRAENLAALEFVDWVVIDPHPTAESILDTLRPDVYVKGREYATSEDPRFLRERSVVESYGGRVIFSSGEVVFSSSRIIGAMGQTEELSERRLEYLCDRHEIDRAAMMRHVARIRGANVVVVGDAIIERYVLCDAKNVSSESPMMSLKALGEQDYAGGAALVALQLAALGARPTLLTAMGSGRLSQWAIERLAAAGVRVRSILPRTDIPLRTRFVVDDRKLFKVEHAEPLAADTASEHEAACIAVRECADADAVILFDSGAGLLGPGFLSALNDSSRERNVVLAGGCGETPGNLLTIRDANLLVCSERKLRLSMNDFDTGLSALVYRAMDRSGAERMIVTLGKRGVVTFQRPSDDPHAPAWKGRLLSEHLPSLAERVVDHFGCGEVMLATGACVAATGGSLMQAAYLGTIASAVQAGVMGPHPITTERLLTQLERRGELARSSHRGRVA